MEWRKAGTMKLVFSNGCFDLCYIPGHIDYLSKAADLGDVLVVGLNTDNSVSRLKGEDRPVNDQAARAVLLAATRIRGRRGVCLTTTPPIR
jgi:cytidyltransferase-like protein